MEWIRISENGAASSYTSVSLILNKPKLFNNWNTAEMIWED